VVNTRRGVACVFGDTGRRLAGRGRRIPGERRTDRDRVVVALPVILVWAVVWRFWRLYAVPAAVAVMVMLPALHGAAGQAVEWLAEPVVVMPIWSTSAVIGLAVPLFLVTMASQNIPRMAVLAVNGYTPPAGPLFRIIGLFTLVVALFGGHAINLAAITAALYAGPDAHPDPTRRYWAAATAGATYVVCGLLVGAAISLIAASPPVLIEAVAGLAHLGVLGSALTGAVRQADGREAALITFLITASGLSFFGVSGVFWGLLAGGAMRALTHWWPKAN
jgi:benzoate membrane transport protein